MKNVSINAPGIKFAKISQQKEQYSLDNLKGLGLSEEDVSKYFNCKKTKLINLQTHEVEYRQVYTLKDDVVINGEKITSAKQLAVALKNIKDTANIAEPKTQYTLNALKEIGLSEEDISKYFDCEKSKFTNLQTHEVEYRDMYTLKDDIVINGEKVTSAKQLFYLLHNSPKKDDTQLLNNFALSNKIYHNI